MGAYNKPNKQIHRGFAYLDDEIIINSLSAIEAGQIDEVVAKIVKAKHGGAGGGVNVAFVKGEGEYSSDSSLEEQMVRTRTRFSFFETWYSILGSNKGLGRFDDWGPKALDGVRPGDTVEVRANVAVAPLQTMVRLFYWFANQAKGKGTLFSQAGPELKSTQDTERQMRNIFDGQRGEIPAMVTPVGEAGPEVHAILLEKWMITPVGRLDGEYTLIGQVEQVVEEGTEWPLFRLTHDAPITPLEMETMKKVVASFPEAAGNLGIQLSDDEATLHGPGLVVTPIAVFR